LAVPLRIFRQDDAPQTIAYALAQNSSPIDKVLTVSSGFVVAHKFIENNSSPI